MIGVNGLNSDRIKLLRIEHGLTREELVAELKEKFNLQISLSALGNYERGAREPSISLVAVLAKFFDVTSDYILGLSDIPKIEQWPPITPDDAEAVECIDAIREAVEAMISSVMKNAYGLRSFSVYATIIHLLPDIDKFASAMLAELQNAYPEYKQFGSETKMSFNGVPLIEALATRQSEDATNFTKRLTSAKAQIHDKIIEINNQIETLLVYAVSDAISGPPLEKQPGYKELIIKIRQSLE